MAYTLKASGIATNLKICVAIDDDDQITEFVSGAKDGSTGSIRFTLGTGVSASVAAGSWQGTARKYWASTANTATDYHGIKFTSTYRPVLATNNSAGWTYFEAFHTLGTRSNAGGLLSYSRTAAVGAEGVHIDASGKAELYMFSTSRGVSTTSPATGGTKMSVAASYDADNTTQSSRFWYGLDGDTGGAGAQEDGVSDHDGWGSSTGEVYGIGGWAGQGNHPASRYVTLLFNKVLSTAEVQSLHDDWFGTLLDVGGGGGSAIGAAAHYYRQLQG